jgi:CheY-like chemotaxis protein
MTHDVHVMDKNKSYVSPRLTEYVPKSIPRDSDPPNPSTPTLLICDDNPNIRYLPRAFVESRTPFEVCGEAEHGMDAIEKAKELQPDLILLDLSMPVQRTRFVRAAMNLLGGMKGSGKTTASSSSKATASSSGKTTGGKKRVMSAAARARISKATKERWAKFRAAKAKGKQ